ncbi:hypothetical protein HID58_061486 [Brassica napus]|nr:uncharacterized protein LOC111205360 [Brassica napus]XP_022556773.1 uncharacterized protein LOC111205360 [Brassica napus]XP_022556774.1 uncharacterized protein LOC111205360 [Brassica napus]XP_022556775.1 uncharacterized protein LOC111205360 [Brassica napus]KAH0885390.1 hypothetical protein HID58_061486 [Brassica napus]CAF1857811.1 unnamed protein product [Brassica napus]
MDSIEAPSFSLGFDLDAASDPKPGLTGDDEPEPGLTVSDSDLELGPGSSGPALKRLRRGFNDISKCSAEDGASELLGRTEDRDDDDDIEEFSSPEDAPASTRSHFSSCSSRVSLRGSGIFTSQPSSISRSLEKRKRFDDVPVTTGPGSGITSVAPLFQSSDRSPLRRFQLLESDSEDDHPSKRSKDSIRVTETNDSSSKRKEAGSLPCTGDLLKDFPPVGVSKTQTPAQRRFQLLDSDSEDDHPSTRSRDLSGVTNTNDPSSKRKEPGYMPTRSPLRRLQILDSDSEDDCPSTRRDSSRVTKTNGSCSKVQPSVASKPKRKELGDLWKDFSPAAVSKIQTPALDDVCQDYFSSINKSTAQKQSSAVASSSTSGLFQQNGHFSDSSNPTPPSHRFFLHSDPRIQNLARKRLPNFLPLGIFNDRENRREECLIDYMNQFGSNGSSKTGVSSSKSCRGRQTKSKVSKDQESSKARFAAVPNDAGRRRVSANTGNAGHWFTSSEGRKVYISKGGQEFSGQSAYRCYKKETGGGFNKSRKKRPPKKKAKK